MAIGPPTIRVEMQFSSGIWSEVADDDVKRTGGLHIRYGIDGNRPQDCVASTGTAQFVLRNDTGNSASTLGYYSPLHGSSRTGWTFGIPCQVVFSHPSDASTTVTITRSSQTATVTHTSHGKSTGEYVTIRGANQAEYNGTWQITNTGANTYTYTVAGSPATPATGTITSRKAYVKHRGRVRTIDPDGNPRGPRDVRVTSYDVMRDIAEADLREVDLMIDVSESEAITAILDALPTESQPIARDIDTGLDTFQYVFDNLESGVKALGVLYDVALSSYMLVAAKGDGTLIARNRSSRTTATSDFTFTNTMHGLSVPTDLGNVFNHVRITIHRRTVSALANEELYSLPAGSHLAIPPSSAVEVFTDYTDPNDRQVAIGGAEVVTSLVAGTHYQAYDTPEGGTDVTANITPTLEAFASTAKWTIVNSSGATAYLTLMKVIGKALRDPGPSTYEATSVQTYGTRTLPLDLRYQSSDDMARDYAAFLEDMYNNIEDQISEIEIIGNYSTDFMRQALEREPGDVITVNESLTGAATDAVIHSVEIEVNEGSVLTCRFGLAPTAPVSDAWILGTDTLGTSTVLGF